jgi:hypothetical protein
MGVLKVLGKLFSIWLCFHWNFSGSCFSCRGYRDDHPF